MSEERPGWRWEEESIEVAGDKRTIIERLVKCSCNGGWVEDEGWSVYEHGYTPTPREREPEAALVPCGFCNFGGWNAPWPAKA